LYALAQIDIAIHIDTRYADFLKQTHGLQAFRALIKPINAHNQKMGLNFSKLEKTYKPITNELYDIGVYKELAEKYE